MRTIGVLLGILLLASPAARAWEVRVNQGRPIALVVGATVEFEIAVTRAAADPISFFGSGIYDASGGARWPLPFAFSDEGDTRCAIGTIDFLPPPDFVNFFQVTPVAAGETVRCRILVQASPDATPGAYPLTLGGASGGTPFTVLILAPTAAAIAVPAGTPWTWLGLGLLLLAARRALAPRSMRGRLRAAASRRAASACR